MRLGASARSVRASVLVRYYMHPGPGGEEGSWTLGPALPAGFKPRKDRWLRQMTPTGPAVLAEGGKADLRRARAQARSVALSKKPAPVSREGETPAPGEEPLLKKGKRCSAPGARR